MNEFNLITDIVVVPNNTHDAKILEKCLPEMNEKTPGINEYHADGGYGSPRVDEIMEENSILLVQNSISGRKAGANFVIHQVRINEYWVTCEYGQCVRAIEPNNTSRSKQYKAIFDYQKCEKCSLFTKCNSRISGGKTTQIKRIWYFSDEKIRLHKRQRNKNSIPKERWTLRSNVEATVKEVKRGIKDGKLRIRGQERISFYLALTSISVNLTRIHKYLHGSNVISMAQKIKSIFFHKSELFTVMNIESITFHFQMNQKLNTFSKQAA